MARGTNLARLLTMFRAETGRAQVAGVGINDDLANRTLLARVQDQLWLDHEWGFLRVDRDFTTQAGQQFYSFPADLSYERIHSVATKWNVQWVPMAEGIGEHEYNLYDPTLNSRNDPVRRWRYREGERLELWPLPASDGIPVRIHGIRNLNPLLLDQDTADLDDQLIVMFAAAESLAGQKSPRAKAMSDAGNRRLNILTSKGDTKRRYRMTDGGQPPRSNELWRLRVTYARAGVEVTGAGTTTSTPPTPAGFTFGVSEFGS